MKRPEGRLWLAAALTLGLAGAGCGTAPEQGARSDAGGTTAVATSPGAFKSGRAAEEKPAATTATTPEGGGATEGSGMALIAAAEDGDAEAVGRLLEEGATVRARDERGQTALVAAASGNHQDVAESLIAAGADVNHKDDTEQSAYLISTSEVGDDPRLLRLTLKNGADVGSLDSYDGTGLIRAADCGHAEIVAELLKTGIDVDHVNNLGWTALLEAIILGEGDARHTEVVRLLVEAGANPNLADGDEVAPLQHAQQRGYDEMAEILRDAGAR